MTPLQISGEAILTTHSCNPSVTTFTHCCNLSVATPTNLLQNLSLFPFPSTSFSSGDLLNSEEEICLDTNKVTNMIKNSNCSLLNVNVRSMNKNYMTFKELVSEIPTKIIAVTETWHPYILVWWETPYHSTLERARYIMPPRFQKFVWTKEISKWRMIVTPRGGVSAMWGHKNEILCRPLMWRRCFENAGRLESNHTNARQFTDGNEIFVA